MSTIKIQLTSYEEKMFNEYAKLCGVSLSALFKQTLEEKLEDEFDMKMIKEYEEDVKNGNVETYTYSEIKRILDL